MRSTTRRRMLLAALALPFACARATPQFVFLSSELQPLRLADGDRRYEVKS